MFKNGTLHSWHVSVNFSNVEIYLNFNYQQYVHKSTEHCRWARKTSYVHLAPEYEYRAKHLRKLIRMSLKYVPKPKIPLGVSAA